MREESNSHVDECASVSKPHSVTHSINVIAELRRGPRTIYGQRYSSPGLRERQGANLDNLIWEPE